MNKLYIAGLGPGNPDHITEETKKYLLALSGRVFLRTAVHPSVSLLDQMGIKYQSFDALYDAASDFDSLYESIAETMLRESENGDLIYVVPGSPMVAEKTVELLLKNRNRADIRVLPAVGFLDIMYAALGLDPFSGVTLLDALSFSDRELTPLKPTIFTQVYNRLSASDLKLRLLNLYPDEHPVTILRALGTDDECIDTIPLFELDRRDDLDHLTSLFVPKAELLPRSGYNEDDLYEVVEILRGENGCPWDREQTLKTLVPQTLEEVYEFVDAVENDDPYNMAEELGDLMLHIVMASAIARDENLFDLHEVISGICEKMIRRHPHVFGTEDLKTSAEVLVKWEEIKKEEKSETTATDRMLSLPKSFPALLYARKLQKRAAEVGFDWDTADQVVEKLREELSEFMEAWQNQDKASIFDEIGDILFTLVNLSRFLSIDLEEALRYNNKKFMTRFQVMENLVISEGKNLRDMTLSEMDQYWDRAKASLKK